MEELPPALRAAVSVAELGVIRQWWEQLPSEERGLVAGMYDPRCEGCFFGPTEDDEGPPLVFGGDCLPHDDTPADDWEDDWREYVVEHPPAEQRYREMGGTGVLLSSMFRSYTVLAGGQFVAEWELTTFPISEMPPSEQLRAFQGNDPLEP